MGIKNPEEFSLKLERASEWLNPSISLQEQGVSEEDVLLLKKKFFFNDANVDRSDPVQLHLLFVQVQTSSGFGGNMKEKYLPSRFISPRMQLYLEITPQQRMRQGTWQHFSYRFSLEITTLQSMEKEDSSGRILGGTPRRKIDLIMCLGLVGSRTFYPRSIKREKT